MGQKKGTFKTIKIKIKMIEAMITYVTTHLKMFVAWFITWWVLNYFEIQVWNWKFNIWKFIISSIIFGLLTEFSSLLIKWNFISTDIENESRKLVLSITMATFLYLFIPFVLQKENRSKFILSVLEKFWFYKKD